MKKVIFISSAGGHLSELLQLESLFEMYDSIIITEKTKMIKTLQTKYPNRFYTLVYGTKKKLFTYLFKFSYNCVKSLYYYIKFKPDVIVTTGTHTAVPLCFIAHFLRKKVIYIETFANSKTKTQTGKMLYSIADLFLVQWEEMLELYPNAEYKGGLF
ncbi:MAG: PssD/Cps14F family polysaccharide biosynthesis glycosyltransferase [Anaerorhabdus sp.]